MADSTGQQPAEPGHTGAVAADPYDRMAWRDLYDRSAALRDLAAELAARHAHTTDLLADAFLAAYLAAPRVREAAEMAPSRRFNRQVVAELAASPGFAALRRETAGDPYAAALAVLAEAPALRLLLDRTEPAREAAARATEARRSADRLSRAAGEAAQQAGATASGLKAGATSADGAAGPASAPAATAGQAASRAEAAARQALEAVAPGIRAAARTATAQAVRVTREEAALMRAWGVGHGELERMPYEQRVRLAERLRTSRLAQWAELIGRFRQMADGERARKIENATGELIGVTLGDDLSRVLPSELAHLGLPELRAVFAARYAAGELMLYHSRGEQRTGQGAVIACVDTSHSMYEEGPGGITREAWSKACALALLDQARHARRDFVGILFSAADKLQVFRFPADRPAPVERVLEFAETFLGGGTSYQRPLSAAADLLAEEFDTDARGRGDIVLITDDECGVTEQWTRDWLKARHRLGFRLFGLAVGAPTATASGSVLEALCDNLRPIEDLTDVRAAADLFRLI
ncbi:hypothetical protein B9W68_02680 [Streptomyces sp. CS227]|uniref:VWA domain-containing protein n=1 Tax=Streptomyces sp. CS227 TaxID=1982763 RepID=UPI000B4122FD|nr:VWA domain-containing protein [Streptomyces sp. CS227]OWA19405.1 hypothetical protein B9W68_02680 [Streptomyces sp. CS227]